MHSIQRSQLSIKPDTITVQKNQILIIATILMWAIFLCVALWPSFATMFTIWVNSSAYHQGIIVLPIALLLIAASLKQHPVENTPPQSRIAFFLMIAISGLWLIGRYYSANIIQHIAFIGIFVSGLVAIFGIAHSKRWAFALTFMFFMVPAGTTLLPILQGATAEAVLNGLTLSGIETQRTGTILTTPVGRFEVTEGCSGLSFILASLMIGTLVSHLGFQSIRKMIAFTIFAVALAIIINWLRVYFVIALATWSQMELGIAEDHLMFGWILYCFVVIGLVWLAKKTADKPKSQPAFNTIQGQNSFKPPRQLLLLIAILLAAVAMTDRIIVQPAISHNDLASTKVIRSGSS